LGDVAYLASNELLYFVISAKADMFYLMSVC